MENKKTFKFDDQDYFVQVPNNKIRRESDSIYAKSYRQAVQDGFFLEAEVEDLLKSRNLDEESIKPQKNMLRKQLEKLEVKLSGCSKEDGVVIVDKMKDTRKEMDKLDAAKNELSAQSASSIAENKRFSFYAYACVTDSDGDRLWESFEDFLEDESDLAYQAATEIISLLYDANKVFINASEKSKPEVKWMVDNGFLDDDLNDIEAEKPLEATKKETKTPRKKRVTKKVTA